MKKTLLVAAAAALFCANAFAAYTVVLRNGTTYKAKAKWTIVNGKAQFVLQTGQAIQVDPADIDEARSAQLTKLGVDAQIFQTGQPTAPAPTASAPSLGANIHLRKQPSAPAAAALPSPTSTVPAAAAPITSSGKMAPEIIEKFARAYENVGLFEQNLHDIDATTLRAELTADTEDKVFNAISATSFLMVHNAGIQGATINMVELFMKMTNGGSSGRFQMTREDAEALDTHKISQQEYFVRRVIY